MAKQDRDGKNSRSKKMKKRAGFGHGEAYLSPMLGRMVLPYGFLSTSCEENGYIYRQQDVVFFERWGLMVTSC